MPETRMTPKFPDRVIVLLDTTPEHGPAFGKLAVLDPLVETRKHAALIREEEEGCCVLRPFVPADLHDSLVAEHRRLRELAEKVLHEADRKTDNFNALRTFLEQSSSGSNG